MITLMKRKVHTKIQVSAVDSTVINTSSAQSGRRTNARGQKPATAVQEGGVVLDDIDLNDSDVLDMYGHDVFDPLADPNDLNAVERPEDFTSNLDKVVLELSQQQVRFYRLLLFIVTTLDFIFVLLV